MKKYFYLMICTLSFLGYSCSDDEQGYQTFPLSVQLVYPENSALKAIEGIEVKLTTTAGIAFNATTNENGIANFIVPAGVYEASATDRRSAENIYYIFNGIKSHIAITDIWTGAETVKLNLTESTTHQLMIKELYVGGCQKDDGSGAFNKDAYVILYNNSEGILKLDNVCLGMVTPLNAHGGNNKDYVDGNLLYENSNWIPAGYAIWYFPNTLTLEGYSQIAIALKDAVDHTQTYSNSINFANAEFYCTYDPSIVKYTGYASPSEMIPTSHYLSCGNFGAGSSWPLSILSPAFYIFRTEGVTPKVFATDETANINYYTGKESDANRRKMIDRSWVLDGIEVYTTTSTNNQKRLTSDIDAGYAYLNNKVGYTSYRNVDKEATEAISDNKSKLVYNYNMGTMIGTKESTDPSGIDAEASIKNGAKIVYIDTNNSTNDFHQRKQASLRD